MKIDVTKIDGYDSMSAEEKLQALENYEMPEPQKPDYTGYVTKEQFDKTSSELAEKKRQLRASMDETQAQKLKEQEEREELEEQLKALQESHAKLIQDNAIAENTAKLIGLNYDEALAKETAKAMVEGNIALVLDNYKKHLDSFEKKLKAEIMKTTPKPGADGENKGFTLKDLRAMSPMERAEYAQNHPEEYRELYATQTEE